MAILRLFKKIKKAIKKAKANTTPKKKIKPAKKKLLKRKPPKKKQIKKNPVKKKAIKKSVRKKVKEVIRKKVPPKTTIKKKIRNKKKVLAGKLPLSNEELLGAVTHYFPKVKAAVFKLTRGNLRLGDKIHIKGHTTDFTQIVKSMQIEHAAIDIANKGDDIGLMAKSRVRLGDSVYKIL